MPVLHRYVNRPGSYVLGWIQESVVTFQLNGEAVARLEAAGISPGTKFPMNLLIDLIREGQAFTRGGEAPVLTGRHDAEQFVFDFEENAEAEKALPVCEETGDFDDLHVVVHGEDGRARLLGPEARRICRDVALSVPLTVLSRGTLEQLVESGRISTEAPCVETLRSWFAEHRREAWEEYRRSRQRAQPALGLETEGELKLG